MMTSHKSCSKNRNLLQQLDLVNDDVPRVFDGAFTAADAADYFFKAATDGTAVDSMCAWCRCTFAKLEAMHSMCVFNLVQESV